MNGTPVARGARGLADIVSVDLADAIADADVVVTGEGSYDRQSAAGKVPWYVAQLDSMAGTPAHLAAGRIAEDADTSPFAESRSLTALAGSREAAVADPERWLRAVGASLARSWLAASWDTRIMTLVAASVASPERFDLAESILWDDAAALVPWVDIRKGFVQSGHIAAGSIVDIEGVEVDETVGAVALAEDGGLLVAGARRLAVIAPDGTVPLDPNLPGVRAHSRLNDGCVDPQGRFVVGTTALDSSLGDGHAAEALLRVSPSGRTEMLRNDVRLSHGVAFSPDGATVYHTDTLARVVSRHSYGPGDFDVDEPWVDIAMALPAYPAGLTVSADGTLWLALWGGSRVQRHAPTGELLGVVTVSAPQPTCAAFVGPDLDTLAITTAQEVLITWRDESGALFLADVGATGLPAARWRGSTISPYWYDEKVADS